MVQQSPWFHRMALGAYQLKTLFFPGYLGLPRKTCHRSVMERL